MPHLALPLSQTKAQYGRAHTCKWRLAWGVAAMEKVRGHWAGGFRAHHGLLSSNDVKLSGKALTDEKAKMLAESEAASSALPLEPSSQPAQDEQITLDIGFNHLGPVGARAILDRVLLLHEGRAARSKLVLLRLDACDLGRGQPHAQCGLAHVLSARGGLTAGVAAKAFPAARHLQSLSLAQTGIDDASADAVGQLLASACGHSLRELSLDRCALGPRGCVGLCRALAGLAPDGAPDPTLAVAVALKSLTLSNAGLTGPDAVSGCVAALCRRGAQPRRIQTRQSKLPSHVPKWALAQVGTDPSGAPLLAGCASGRDRSRMPLALPSLTRVVLSGSTLCPESLRMLATGFGRRGAQLRLIMELECCVIGPEGASVLAEELTDSLSACLDGLHLQSNPIGPAGLIALARAAARPAASGLRTLRLRARRVDGEHAVAALGLLEAARPGLMGPMRQIGLMPDPAAVASRRVVDKRRSLFSLWAAARKPDGL